MTKLIKALLLALLLPTVAHPGSALTLSWVSLDDATKQVRKDSNKKVLGAKTESIDGREVHVIKILTPDGRIQNLRIDAETGQLLSRDQ
ncbi:MAG: PepSY domain-containing protein [Gammaproteobacteria bacterium]